jgi:hypothetical protein
MRDSRGVLSALGSGMLPRVAGAAVNLLVVFADQHMTIGPVLPMKFWRGSALQLIILPRRPALRVSRSSAQLKAACI